MPNSDQPDRRGARCRQQRLWRTLATEVGLLVLLVACGGERALTGTDLDKQPAPDFTLTDQRGQTIRLSELRGKAVALTFIYTNCPDVCPLTAENFRIAYEGLPAKTRQKVALVAVTVDPARDTPAALQAFSATHRLADNPNWYALYGDQATLEQVWRAYGIDPGAAFLPTDHQHAAGASPVGRTPGSPAAVPPVQLGHTDAIYLIDREGRERVLMHSDAGSEALTKNLKALAG